MEKDTNRLLLNIVIIADLVTLIVTSLAFINFFPDICAEFIVHHQATSILVFIISYLVGIHFFPPTLFRRQAHIMDVVRRVMRSTCVFIIVCTTILLIIKDYPISGLWIFIFFPLLMMLTISERLILRFIIREMRKRGRNRRDVVFVGSNTTMVDIYNSLIMDPAFGYFVKGYFDYAPNPNMPDTITYLGPVDDVLGYIEKHNNIRELYCCLTSDKASEIIKIIRCCEKHVVHFLSVPNVRTYLQRVLNMTLVGDVPVLYINPNPLNKLDNRIFKRLFDIAMSFFVLVTIFPILFIFVAVVTKLTMPGPIFFRQKRNGLNGNEFWCYKFRSMRVNDECDTKQATKDDPRKTKWGEIIRKTNIDEFPQFWNVLIGDMSIVGPRPHMLKHTALYSSLIEQYMLRHFAKPGITGWAQVTGSRGETKEVSQMEERVHKDIWYIEHWSFPLDLRIIWLTIRNVLIGDKKAY